MGGEGYRGRERGGWRGRYVEDIWVKRDIGPKKEVGREG